MIQSKISPKNSTPQLKQVEQSNLIQTMTKEYYSRNDRTGATSSHKTSPENVMKNKLSQPSIVTTTEFMKRRVSDEKKDTSPQAIRQQALIF